MLFWGDLTINLESRDERSPPCKGWILLIWQAWPEKISLQEIAGILLYPNPLRAERVICSGVLTISLFY